MYTIDYIKKTTLIKVHPHVISEAILIDAPRVY